MRNPFLIIFYPTCHQMDRMFMFAVAFNQPLPTFDTALTSAFDTSAVTSVSAYLCWVHLDVTQNSDFHVPTKWFSDEHDVRGCSSLQSTTSCHIWYCQGWERESISVLSPTWWETGFWSFPTQLVIRCMPCSQVQRPLINHCLPHSIRLRLQLWVHICAESNLIGRQHLILPHII